MTNRFCSPVGGTRTYVLLAFIACCGMIASSLLSADDWPFWRGPDRNDKSNETGLLSEWPEGGPEVEWINKESGLGYAGFSVVGSDLFTLGLEDDSEFALCLDANTGKEKWRTPLAGRYQNAWGDGPRSTPTVDGDHVYFMTGQGTLACLNRADGKEVWSIEMKDFGGEVPQWGYAESPLVDGDHVICTPGGNQTTMVAVDKQSGTTVWKTEAIAIGDSGPRKAHYSSILPAEIHGKKQYVQLLERGVVGIDPENGNVLWKHPFPGRTAVIPSPLVFDNQVYVTAGYGAGSKLLKISPENEVTEVWFTKGMENHHGSVVKIGDHIYGYSSRTFNCQSIEDGERVWAERRIEKGALAYADGLVYYVQKGDGRVMLLDVSPESAKVKGSFTLDPQTKRRSNRGAIWVHPVIANGKLYLRDQEIIICYDISAK